MLLKLNWKTEQPKLLIIRLIFKVLILSRKADRLRTQTLKDELNGNKPELKTRRIKKSIRRQIKALRDLIDDVNEGVYDGGDDLPWGNNNYNVGRDTTESTSDNNINGVSGRDIFRAAKAFLRRMAMAKAL